MKTTTVIHNHNTFVNGVHTAKTTETVTKTTEPYVPPPGPEAPFGLVSGDIKSFHRLVVSCPLCSRRQRAMFFLRSWEDAVSLLDGIEHMVVKSGGGSRIFNERAPLWDKIARISDPLGRKAAVEAVVWFFTRMQERSVDVARACERAIEKAESLLSEADD